MYVNEMFDKIGISIKPKAVELNKPTPAVIDEMMYVLAYDDHADGNTYLSYEMLVELPYVFTTAIAMLAEHDNVLITDTEHYEEVQHDFYALAPYSITMGLGIYAKPTMNPPKM
jgi:hypothetical protein